MVSNSHQLVILSVTQLVISWPSNGHQTVISPSQGHQMVIRIQTFAADKRAFYSHLYIHLGAEMFGGGAQYDKEADFKSNI